MIYYVETFLQYLFGGLIVISVLAVVYAFIKQVYEDYIK